MEADARFLRGGLTLSLRAVSDACRSIVDDEIAVGDDREVLFVIAQSQHGQ
jgi:hypothetical protein